MKALPLSTSLLILIITVSMGCNKVAKQQIVQRADYLTYLSDQDSISIGAAKTDSQIQFWERKLQSQPKSHLFLQKKAGLLSKRFKFSGRIRDIHESDSILNHANAITNGRSAAIYRSLASNAITRHQFRQALDHLKNAWNLGEGKQVTLLLAVDVNMELGNYEAAEALLAMIENQSTFDYLIRLSKLEDHKGDLSKAIITMEKAFDRINNNDNRSIYCWALSNLGDMYGHAGRVRESYNCYLKVLEKDPKYYYALQSLAWIAYSHDEDPVKSLEILDFLKSKSQLPDQLLLEAEIASFMGNKKLSNECIKRFYDIASTDEYQNIYNKYLSLAATETLVDYRQGLRLALKEIDERPTAQSYDLLAWNYLHNGAVEKAFEIAETRIEGKTFEPEILYHLGVIYLAKGEKRKSNKYLKAALESSFELGPVISEKIKGLL